MNEIPEALPKILAEIADLGELQSIYAQESGPEQVARMIEKALIFYPSHGVAKAARGWALFAEGKFPESVQWFTQALESAEATRDLEAEWLCFRGGCHFRMGDWKNALRDHVRARDLDPEQARGHFVLATTFRELGDHPSAVLCYAVAAFLDGTIPTPELFAKLVDDPNYSDPIHVETSLRVLSDPLDVPARVLRAETLAMIESPRAALYDLMMADSLAPGNLGVMVRIDDLQRAGILAGGPVYEVPPQTATLHAVHARFLAEFEHAYRTRLLPRELQPLAFPVERLFGPSSIVPPGDSLALPFHSVVVASVGTLTFALPGIVILASLDGSGGFPRGRDAIVSGWVDHMSELAVTIAGGACLAIAFAWLVFGCYWFMTLLPLLHASLAEKRPRMKWLLTPVFFVGILFGIPFYLVALYFALTVPLLALVAGFHFGPHVTGVILITIVGMSAGHLTGISQTSPYHPHARRN